MIDQLLFSYELDFAGKPPNPFQSWADLRIAAKEHYFLTGSVYIWPVRNQAGELAEVHMIPATEIMPVPPSEKFPNGAWRIVTKKMDATIPFDAIKHTGNK